MEINSFLQQLNRGILGELDQGSSTSGPRPTSGPWGVWNRDVEMPGKHAHTHPHLHEQRVGAHACRLCKCSCACTLASRSHRTIPSSLPPPRWSTRPERLGNSERDNIIHSLYRSMKINSSVESCWHSKINCMQSGYSEMSRRHRQWCSVEKCCFDLHLKSDHKIIFLFIRNGQKVLFCKMLDQIFKTIYRKHSRLELVHMLEKPLSFSVHFY